MAQTFDVAGPDVAAEEFDGEYVVLDLKNGMYYSVGGGAGVVWRALVAGHSAEALKQGVPDGDSRAAEIDRTVEAFVGHGLMAAAPREASGDVGEFVAALLAAEPDFRVEGYGDLAELLVADPIHDVDTEVGWPKRPDHPA
jgi:hypothetical protein